MEASVSSLKQSRVRARVCKLNILFFFLFCVSPSSPSEEVKQRGSPVADDANISPFINRINYAIIRTATLTPSGFMYTGSNNFTTLSASPQQKQLHICREKKHCRKSTVSTKSASFLSIETRFFCYQQVTSAVTLFSIWAAEVSWDIYCEHVNRLCCASRGHDLCHINPPLYAWTHQVTGANASKITWLSVQHIRLIIMFLFSVS